MDVHPCNPPAYGSSQSVEGFLEESVVRRELSDNYCYYNPRYDDISTSYDWVTETLKVIHGKSICIYTNGVSWDIRLDARGLHLDLSWIRIPY